MSTAYELFWSAALGNNSKLVNLAKAATEELRAENASLKEAISLSEDSRLMDEYLKLERANARQAERIAELEAQLVIEKGQLDLRDEENRILFAKSEAQSAVIEMAKTAMDSAKKTEGWDEVPYRLHVKLDALFDAIDALPSVAEQKASE